MSKLKYVLVIALLAYAIFMGIGDYSGGDSNAPIDDGKAVMTLHVQVPENTPKDAVLTLGGSFNGWQPNNSDYVLTKITDIHYMFEFAPQEPGKVISFKVTRGSWDTVELALNGSNIDNHEYWFLPGKQSFTVKVEQWADFNDKVAPSTVVGNVLIEDVSVPTFDVERKVRVYLPADYETANKRYPVIYMTDGQNIFDKALSSAGEWKMDELMEQMQTQGSPLTSIVVGIDHAGKNRQAEYDPWDYQDDGKTIVGKGDEFADFMALTLKPMIDRRFNTKPEREHTMIMGSSMGGLIALFIGVKHADKFGRTAGLSSALLDDLIGEHFVTYISKQASNPISKFYFDIGSEEVQLMTPSIFDDSQAIYDALIQIGYKVEQLNYQVIEGGVHNEASWSSRTENILRWLYQ